MVAVGPNARPFAACEVVPWTIKPSSITSTVEASSSLLTVAGADGQNVCGGSGRAWIPLVGVQCRSQFASRRATDWVVRNWGQRKYGLSRLERNLTQAEAECDMEA
jgi:hypothetical protein